MVGFAVPEGPEAPEPGDDVKVRDVEVSHRRGRPRKSQNEDQLARVLNLYFIEKMSMRKVADILGVSHMSVYRMLSDPNIELLI